VKHR